MKRDLEERLKTSLEPLMQTTPPWRHIDARSTRRYRWQPVIAVVSAIAVAATVAAIVFAGRLVREPSGSGTSRPPASGVIGKVVLSGGPPPGTQLQGQRVVLTISAAGHTVVSKEVASSRIVKVPISPGTYQISALDGSANCSASSVQVKAGAFTSFEVICSIR